MCIDILFPYINCLGFDLPRLNWSFVERFFEDPFHGMIQQIKIELKQKLKLLTLLLNCGIASDWNLVRIPDSNTEKY